MTNAAGTAKIRIDKWLWAARFFKTRSLAGDAIAKNRIRVGGQRIKASRTVAPGDTVIVEKPPYAFEVTILALNDQRRPAAEAQLLYEESAESQETRRKMSVQLRSDRVIQFGLAGSGRPTKKQRRQIIRFQNINDVPDPASDD